MTPEQAEKVTTGACLRINGVLKPLGSDPGIELHATHVHILGVVITSECCIGSPK